MTTHLQAPANLEHLKWREREKRCANPITGITGGFDAASAFYFAVSFTLVAAGLIMYTTARRYLHSAFVGSTVYFKY